MSFPINWDQNTSGENPRWRTDDILQCVGLNLFIYHVGRRKFHPVLSEKWGKVDDDDDDDAEKLKQVGKKRVRTTFSGWLEINVQPRLTTSCQHRHHRRRRRRGRRGRRLKPLALLLRVSDVARSTAGDVRQLVSAPVNCSSPATQLDTGDHLGR